MKVFGTIALVVVLLFVVLLVTGGHNPGRHTLGDGSEGHTPPAAVPEHGK